MYCPRCSQQQASEETKFCSRCGFPLGLISEILAHGGFLPQLAELYNSKKRLTKRNGIVFSVMWMMFFVLILVPIFGIMDFEEAALACAVTGIFGGIMWLIASLMFLKNPSKEFFPANEPPNANAGNIYATNQKILPAEQSPTAQNYVSPADSWRAPNTGEFSRPQSVTDHTTKLLKKEQE